MTLFDFSIAAQCGHARAALFETGAWRSTHASFYAGGYAGVG